MPDYNTIISFFDEYISHYRELLSFENQKFEYIITNKVSELGNCLSKEQALIMKGNSLETKRVSLLEKEGLAGMKFKELVDSAPEQYAVKIKSRFNELSKYISEVKRINDEAMGLVRSKLAVIESKLPTGNTYDGKGDRKSTINSSSLTRNI